MKTVVIYHRADFDGIFCREIAKKFLPEAELIGWDYGDPEPIVTGRERLYMLDISVAGLMMHQDLIWIDHHKSAIEKWPTEIPGYRIDGVAACRLAWQWFLLMEAWDHREMHPPADLPTKDQFFDRTVSEPLAVRLAGEYDIWDKRDPRAELFQHGLRGAERDFEWLLTVGDPAVDANFYVDKILEEGRAIRYAKTEENSSIITSYGFTVKFEGLTFLACNHARFNSHLFTAGIRPEHEALVGFCYDGKKGVWRVSLYHAPGHERHDLSLIAARRGGGGHRGACGFQSSSLPFIVP